MRVLVLLVALLGPIRSQFNDYKLQAADDSGRYISDDSGDYIHQPGPDGPDYKGEAATNLGVSILPENSFLIPNPPLNPRTYLPPVSAGPVRTQPLPPLELPLPPAFTTRNANPPSHLPITSIVGTPSTSLNSIPFEGKRKPPVQSVTIVRTPTLSRRQSPPNGRRIPLTPSPAIRPSPIRPQSNGGRPNIRISSPTVSTFTPKRPLPGSHFSGTPNAPTSPTLTSFGTGSRKSLIPSQSSGRLTTGLGGSPTPRRTITLTGPPPAEISSSIKRPGIKGGGPYIWDYASTGPHVVDVSDPYHKYRVHFVL